MVEVRSRPGAARSVVARWAAAAGWWAGFLVLTAAVAWGLPDELDRRALALVRPGEGWGPEQVRWDMVVEAFRPPVVSAALAVVVIAVALARRTVRPVVVAVVAGAVTAGASQLVKLALARPDPHLTGTSSGSFPSGHTVSVVVCVGLAISLVRPQAPGWVRAVPVLAAGAVMGVALVVTGAHWASDVLGGLVLGLAVLSTVAAADGDRPET
jgi:membrane-associated phospholipid phosphatase